MKNTSLIILFLIGYLSSKSQELPLPFPKDYKNWEYTDNAYIKVVGNKAQSFMINTPNGYDTYSNWHTGSLITVTRTEWIEFWKIYNTVSNLEESVLDQNEMEGFYKDEPLKGDGNFYRLRIGDLYMKVVYKIIVESKIHFYIFLIDDEKFSIGHAIVR